MKELRSLRRILLESESEVNDGLVIEGDTLVKSDKGISGDIVIPEGIKTIADRAFWGCDYLTSVKLPHSLLHIGEYAFSLCPGLQLIEIPENVVSFGPHAFQGCNFLESAIFKCDNIKYLSPGIFANCSSLENVKLPKRLKYILRDSFLRCSSLVTIDIPRGVVAIGEEAFFGCESLVKIRIPDSIKFIEKDVFNECPSLKSISFPNKEIKVHHNWMGPKVKKSILRFRTK